MSCRDDKQQANDRNGQRNANADWLCDNCARASPERKIPFHVLGKSMCSPKCCADYRQRVSPPQQTGKSGGVPRFGGGCAAH